MHPRSFVKLSLICVFCLILAVLSWVMTPDYSGGRFLGQELFPGFLERVNDVAVMSVEHEGQTVTFVRDAADNWTLMEADHYPADRERIRNTLIGIAGLEKVEPKTALPEFYPDIGVEDNSKPNAKSYLVTLLDGEGRELLGLLVGKSVRGIRWDGVGYFVRFPDEAQSWLVRGALDVTGDVRSWLPVRILPLSRRETASMTMLDGTKKREIIFRRLAPQLPLRTEYKSDPYFLTSPDYLAEAEEALTSLDFSDVAERPADLDAYDPFFSMNVQTFAGLEATLRFYLIEGRPFVALSYRALPDASKDARREAERLEQRHEKWFYQLPNAKVNALLPFLPVPEAKKAEPEKPEKVREKEKEALKVTVLPPKSAPKDKKEPPKKAEPAEKKKAAKKAAPKAVPAVKTASKASDPAKKKEAPKKAASKVPVVTVQKGAAPDKPASSSKVPAVTVQKGTAPDDPASKTEGKEPVSAAVGKAPEVVTPQAPVPEAAVSSKTETPSGQEGSPAVQKTE
ncbi:MAG: DUF4340 domain-containing protein [Alphaproteobacteria bacterium]|jgi:hypothetical protein